MPSIHVYGVVLFMQISVKQPVPWEMFWSAWAGQFCFGFSKRIKKHLGINTDWQAIPETKACVWVKKKSDLLAVLVTNERGKWNLADVHRCTLPVCLQRWQTVWIKLWPSNREIRKTAAIHPLKKKGSSLTWRAVFGSAAGLMSQAAWSDCCEGFDFGKRFRLEKSWSTLIWHKHKWQVVLWSCCVLQWCF